MLNSVADMSYLGVSEPISTASPTPQEEQFNEELNTFLTLHRVAESEEGNRKREIAVDTLLGVFKEWVSEVAVKRGVDTSKCESAAGARLFVFGSQRLGVHSRDADIDILCCAPQFVTRYDFFLSFLDKLKTMPNVMNILSLPEAYTPVIKFSLNSYSIDLIFVALAMSKIPQDFDILTNDNLKNLDEASVRSLNGVRVTERILQLVPCQGTFCTALRAIKCWATRRGIYANVLGFLGGVNYAILVAFVCQRFPKACPSTIIKNVFQIFSQWHWPSPILLTNINDTYESDQSDTVQKLSWNPKKNPADGFHLMPIITPAYPSMNSAFNVCIPQYRMIQLEIQRGLFLFQTMEKLPSMHANELPSLINGAGVASKLSPSVHDSDLGSNLNKVSSIPHSILWNTLFASASSDFFQVFPRYIQVEITSKSASEHRLWFGWCESRLRQLFVSVEQTQMAFCHPFANCFHRQVPMSKPELEMSGECDTFSSCFFMGLSFPEGTRSLDLTDVIQSFKSRVCSWVGKTSHMDLKLKPLQGCDLPEYVFTPSSVPSNSFDCTSPSTLPSENSSNLSRGFSVLPTSPKFAECPRPSTLDRPFNGKGMDSACSVKRGGKIPQSGSTPQLASLALNNRNDDVNNKNEHKALNQRIEKQLFSDDNKLCRVDNVNTNGLSKSPLANINTAAELYMKENSLTSTVRLPLPPRSPNKTSRKEFSSTTGSAASDVLIPQSDSGSSQEGKSNILKSNMEQSDQTTFQHQSHDSDNVSHILSSPLKRVRPN